MHLSRALAGLFAAAVLCAPPAVHAQDAFSLQLFRPSVDSKGYFSVNGSEVLGHLDFSIGLVGAYARDVLDLRASGARFAVSDFVTAQVQAALGLFRWAELGVSLPVHILFGSRGPRYVSSASGNFDDDLTFGAQMIGDLGLHAKARLLDGGKRPVGLALVASVYAPTGPSSRLLGEGQVTLRPELVLDKELGPSRRVRVALNVGVLIRPSRHTFTDRGTTLNVPGSNVDRTANGGDPFCFPAPTLTMAPMTCGTGESRSLGSQVTFGLGVSGAVVPQKFELLAELYGYADVTGSPGGFPLEWRAGGKLYLASKSHFEFGAGTGIVPGQTGSPSVRAFIGFIFEPSIGDRDGDGIKDDVDQCPDEPEDRDDFEDEDGCPDPDNDHDGILDRDDKCPNQPETFNGFEDEDGCPDELEPEREEEPVPERLETTVRVRRHAIEIGKIYFETGKATIKPISYPVLDALTAALIDHPQLQLVEVQGHADERGDDDYNLRLTEDRAQAVERYLIDHGIDPARLQARGYGETRPVCRRHDPACWSKNRRVEFIIVRQEGEIPGQER